MIQANKANFGDCADIIKYCARTFDMPLGDVAVFLSRAGLALAETMSENGLDSEPLIECYRMARESVEKRRG